MMAKRGEVRPWRVVFVWEESGIRGTQTFGDEASARSFAGELGRNSELRGEPIRVDVARRPAAKLRSVS